MKDELMISPDTTTIIPPPHKIVQIEDGKSITLSLVDQRPHGKFTMPVILTRDGDKIWITIQGFSKTLNEELKKNLDGMQWWGFKDPPIKKWSCKYCEHNLFRFAFLASKNPYALFDQPKIQVDTEHPVKQHQRELANEWLTVHFHEFAAEMGLGKSLSAIVAVEHMFKHGLVPKDTVVFWVAPKSALVSVQLEYRKWKCKFPIEFMTYEGLKKYTETIDAGTKPPRVLIGDESQKLKHGTSQRTKSFEHVARAMRQEYGNDCYTLLMTGTPAPKSPADWYSQAEILCPGYLKEGNISSFKMRMSLVKQKEAANGAGVYPELITWLDDSRKCAECGQTSDHFDHDKGNDEYHAFKKSINEVELLAKRLKGLVTVKTKKECTDLPDKIYRKVYCKPRQDTLRAMQMIAQVQPSAIKVLTLLRELSDGFQYADVADGRKTCDLCKGTGQYTNYTYVGPEKTAQFLQRLVSELETTDEHSPKNLVRNKLIFNIECCPYPEDVILDPNDFPQFFDNVMGDCPHCDGLGTVINMIRSYKDTKTTKDQALIDILEEHEDVGRLVVYAGFTASIDRCIEIAKDQKWDYIRLDGRGWSSSLEGKPLELIEHFQDKNRDDKVVFIGNPGSAGTGLTLTASPSICYFSNDFLADARQQSEDRIHRLGMDENRGATIIDLIHLPTDEYVLENLTKKKRLQDISMGQIVEAMAAVSERSDYE